MGEKIAVKVRDDAQQLVITRLLDCVHDPLTQFSRLQRIYPRAWLNDNSSTRSPDFHWAPVVDLLRYMAEAYSYTTTTCGRNHRVPARILT